MVEKASGIISQNLEMIDKLVLNEIILSGHHEVLLTSNRDITYALKEDCNYHKSFAVPQYNLTTKTKQLLNNDQIKTYYVYEYDSNDSIINLCFYLVNCGKRVYVLNKVNEYSILRPGSEIDKLFFKATPWLEYLTTMEFKKYDSMVEQVKVEKFIASIFKQIDNFESIDRDSFCAWLQGIVQLQDQSYNLILLPFLYQCMIKAIKGV